MKILALQLVEREAYKRARRYRKLEQLVKRLRARVENSDVSLRAVCAILKELAETPDMARALKALNERN